MQINIDEAVKRGVDAHRAGNLQSAKLTENSEQKINSLFHYLGIPAQDLCFSPHNNPRRVNTVAELQVKKPIYKDSSKSWIRYSHKIGSHFEGL